MNLIIDGVIISDEAALEIKQSYGPLNKGTRIRMMDGSAVNQISWQKQLTKIEGKGWVPPGLSGIDFTLELIVDCVAKKDLQSDSNIITIPGTIRPDIAPEGLALVDGQWQESNSTLAGNDLTIDVVTGATKYMAIWCPRFTMFFDEPDVDDSMSDYDWSLVGEEV